MPAVPLSERQLTALAWALAVLRDCNPIAAYPPPEAGCDRNDLITATTEINHALRRAREPEPRVNLKDATGQTMVAARVPFP